MNLAKGEGLLREKSKVPVQKIVVDSEPESERLKYAIAKVTNKSKKQKQKKNRLE